MTIQPANMNPPYVWTCDTCGEHGVHTADEAIKLGWRSWAPPGVGDKRQVEHLCPKCFWAVRTGLIDRDRLIDIFISKDEAHAIVNHLSQLQDYVRGSNLFPPVTELAELIKNRIAIALGKRT